MIPFQLRSKILAICNKICKGEHFISVAINIFSISTPFAPCNVSIQIKAATRFES